MLTKTPLSGDSPAELDTFHNYYESLVLREIEEQLQGETREAGFVADAACVALNHLPPRYIRYDVDMSFYLSPLEREEMEAKVAGSVREAIAFVKERERGASG